jgi:hypothetical protein
MKSERIFAHEDVCRKRFTYTVGWNMCLGFGPSFFSNDWLDGSNTTTSKCEPISLNDREPSSRWRLMSVMFLSAYQIHIVDVPLHELTENTMFKAHVLVGMEQWLRIARNRDAYSLGLYENLQRNIFSVTVSP